MSIKDFFKKPHPFIFNRSSLIIPFLVTALILLIFQPFEFAHFSSARTLALAIVFGGTAAACVFITTTALRYLFPDYFDEEEWTLGKEILLIITVIASITLVLFLFFLFITSEKDWISLFQVVFVRTLLISIFPVIILVLYEQLYYQKSKWKEAQGLNQKLLQKQHVLQQDLQDGSAPVAPEKITLTGENDKMALQIEPSALVYFKSEGNYVEVFYLHNQSIQKELIRNRLKVLEKELSSTLFFRCHKSYIINSKHLLKVEGNARNLELILQNVEDRIPVSRSKSAALSSLLKAGS